MKIFENQVFGPWKLGKSVAQRLTFDALSERQHVTESLYINSLADLTIWSTIKTLPEPWSVVLGL